MSVIYRGVHRPSGQVAAVKVLNRKTARNSRLRRSFRREVHALARLNHPGIVRVLDLGEVDADAAHASDGELVAGSQWFAMEMLRGVDLSRKTAITDWTGLVDLLLELLDALGHAHARGVIHRDLKPENVLMLQDATPGHIKLIDFGVTQFTGDSDDHRRREVENRITGTPQYMAPEQIRGRWRQQGPWTDLYAFGCLAWRLICGQSPYEGNTRQVLTGHIKEPLPDFEPRFAVPETVYVWLSLLLSKSPQARFRRAADARFALARLADESETAILRGAEDRPAEQPSTDLFDTVSQQATTRLSVDRLDQIRPGDSQSPSAPARAVGQWGRPELPDHWERSTEPRRLQHLSDAGLRLFGVRSVPVVDRNRERDKLWRLLDDARRTNRPHALLLRGEAGCGKSHLAKWFIRRAHELGAATILEAGHDPMGGLRNGIGGMLSDYFRCRQLDWADTFERIKGIYETLGFDEATGLYDAMGFSSLICVNRDQKQGPNGFETPRQRHLALERLLGKLARRRPLVLWFDNIHWGPQSAELVDFLLDDVHTSGLPISIVMTSYPIRSALDPKARALLDEIGARNATDVVDIGPLHDVDQRRLVNSLLDLDDQLVDEVVSRTAGNPSFAVQLIEDWVDRDVLAPGEDGLTLADAQLNSTPDDVETLGLQRFDALFSSRPPDQRRDIGISMEIAAAMGQHINRAEWTEACRRSGVAVRSRWIERLVDLGLIRPDEDGWIFAQAIFRDGLRRRAVHHGRWRAHHRQSARALSDLYSVYQPGIALRRARHLAAADDVADAADAFLIAEDHAFACGRYDECDRCLDRHAELVARLEDSSQDLGRADNQWRRARVLVNRGQPRRATDLVDRTMQLLQTRDETEQWAYTAQLKGRLLRAEGDFDGATQIFERAQRCFARLGMSDGVATCYASLGYVALYQGRIARARQLFRESEKLFSRSGDLYEQGRIQQALASVALVAQDVDACRRAIDRASVAARQSGGRAVEAACWNILGDLARDGRHWAEARRCYSKGAHISSLAGSRNALIARYNLALVHLAEDDVEAAKSLLHEVRKGYAETGLQMKLPLVWLGLAVCAAAQRVWHRWDDLVGRVHRRLADSVWVHRDAAQLAEQAAEAAHRAGESDRAADVLRLAISQYRELGRPDRADALAETLQSRGAAAGDTD